MSKAKYNFHEIKKLPELPSDVNEICINALSKLDPTGDAVRFFMEKQNKKLFGTFNFIHPRTLRLTASFEMHNGVVKMFKLIEFMGETQSHFFRTVLNDNVTFESKRGVNNGKETV